MGPRIAYASGVAACVGAALVLAGRFPASVVLALLLVQAARTGADAALVQAGPIVAAEAARNLTAQIARTPALAIVAAAGVVRAGSSGLSDVRGANAVAGLALARGPALTVAGAWLALAAGIVAVSTTWNRAAIGPEGAGGFVPAPLKRLELAGVVGQVALLVTLFAGPQVRSAADAVPWAVFGVAIGAVVVAGRRVAPARGLSLVSTAAAALGLALVLVGGRP